MSDLFTPKRLSQRLDTLGCIADALEIVCGAAEEGDIDREKCQRSIGALAHQISADLDALYCDVQEAMGDPDSFMGTKKRR